MKHFPENALRKHLQWVLHTTRTLNLTTITNPEEAWQRHVLDSCAAGKLVAEAPSGALLDMGSGAGYPGVPLGLLSGRETLCVDSVQKKAHALEAFLRSDPEFSHITSTGQRLEEIARNLGNSEQDSNYFTTDSSDPWYAVVVARALAGLPSLVELASPLLQPGGHALFFKGQLTVEEREAGRAAAQICGLTEDVLESYALEDLSDGPQTPVQATPARTRTIVRYIKTHEPRVALPRRNGVAQKRPYR
ncbi:MAG: class I SAM-dependent methyltransferase [Coriobacteriia bacterium]|nr:class I SAM-dependent methyltransferase [Coriobacteriia bacterium]